MTGFDLREESLCDAGSLRQLRLCQAAFPTPERERCLGGKQIVARMTAPAVRGLMADIMVHLLATLQNLTVIPTWLA
jgi:hypothetical protein